MYCHALTAVLSALLTVPASTTAAQPYPSKPLRIVVMYGPGSTIDIMARLHKEITRIQTLPDIRERFVQLGTEPTTNTPEQFTALVHDELAKWRKVIKTAGVKVE